MSKKGRILGRIIGERNTWLAVKHCGAQTIRAYATIREAAAHVETALRCIDCAVATMQRGNAPL